MATKFKSISEVLDKKYEGKKVQLRGWVYRKRSQKKMIFLIIRDESDIIQTIIKEDSPLWKTAQEITIESSLEIIGKIKKDKRAPTGFELQTSQLKIIDLADRWPFTRDLSEEFTREQRHLWVRSRKITELAKIKSLVYQAIREFYVKKGYYEVPSPMFTSSAVEGGSTLFEVKYFGKKAYLAQTWQLYAEAMIYSLEKIYCIAPSFRAEKSRTRRHLTEYWHHEMEAAWVEFDELLKIMEELVIFIAHYIAKHGKDSLIKLGKDPKDLKKFKGPFVKMTYKEALKKIGKKWGHDLTDKEERDLVKKIGKPIFLTHFPRDMKAFYMKPDPKDPKTVLAADLLMPGVGETFGSSERIETEEELLKSLKIFKLKKKDYDWYLDLRKYGSVPHSGYGMGVERLVMWLTGTEHIMDTVPFPRTMDRLHP